VKRRQSGVTLVELVVAITIVAVAVTSVLGAMGMIATHSADAMVMHQATAIAESYLEEATLKPVEDPDGADGEGDRADYDDVDDYAGLADAGPRTPDGDAIDGLADYTVRITVENSDALPDVDAARVRRVDVTVTHATGVSATLTGYRVD
jgi:MSHA pilin protein MshD